MISLYRWIRDKRMREADNRFVEFKRTHSTSFSATGKACKCGRDHQSINILDKDMQIIESEVCPFMYYVRNACLRARFGNHIPKVDSGLLQEVSKL